MEINEIANRLVELGREGKWDQAQDELFAENAVSIEPEGTPMNRVEGLAGIRQKAQQWADMTEEVHGGSVSEPVIGDNYFSVSMMMDVTMKGQGRNKMEEVAVYNVQDGKIVSEQFFYTPPPMN